MIVYSVSRLPISDNAQYTAKLSTVRTLHIVQHNLTKRPELLKDKAPRIKYDLCIRICRMTSSGEEGAIYRKFWLLCFLNFIYWTNWLITGDSEACKLSGLSEK